MIVQAAELGDTGRQVVLWVAMGLALWQLLMFAASTFVQGKNLVKGLCTFTLLHGCPPWFSVWQLTNQLYLTTILW